MINCYLDPKVATIALLVGQYVRDPDGFSPLVKRDAESVYSELDGCDFIPTWPTSTEVTRTS